jgi:TRAP-type transport system small permease protein
MPAMGNKSNFSAIWERYGNFTRRVTVIISIIGGIGLTALILFTVIDVMGSKLFNRPFPGYTGVTELCQMIAIAFAMGITYLGGHHITIELLKGRLPRRAEAAMGSFIHLLGLGLFGLIIWRLILIGRAFQTSGEVVDQIFAPLYPFAYALAIAMVPVGLILIFQLVNAFRGMVQR